MNQSTSRPSNSTLGNNVIGYKINSKTLVALLYTNDKWTDKEIRETLPFIVVTNNLKFLGVTLSKQVKGLYDKNFKSLKKDIEEDIKKWKDNKNGSLTKRILQIECNSH